jgi:predicted ATP-dependent protease
MQPVLLEVPPGEQDRLPVLQETSLAEQGKSSALQDMLQLLEEEMQGKIKEKREKEEMQRVHWLEMGEIQKETEKHEEKEKRYKEKRKR